MGRGASEKGTWGKTGVTSRDPPLTISSAPLRTPQSMFEYQSSFCALPSSGNSTKSANGFSSKINENCLLSVVQFVTVGVMFRKTLNPTYLFAELSACRLGQKRWIRKHLARRYPPLTQDDFKTSMLSYLKIWARERDEIRIKGEKKRKRKRRKQKRFPANEYVGGSRYQTYLCDRLSSFPKIGTFSHVRLR